MFLHFELILWVTSDWNKHSMWFPNIPWIFTKDIHFYFEHIHYCHSRDNMKPWGLTRKRPESFCFMVSSSECRQIITHLHKVTEFSTTLPKHQQSELTAFSQAKTTKYSSITKQPAQCQNSLTSQSGDCC